MGLSRLSAIRRWDASAPPSSQPIDDTPTFVCQHYHVFLWRVPGSSGLEYWLNCEVAIIGDASSLQRALGKATSSTAAFGNRMKATGRTLTHTMTSAEVLRVSCAENPVNDLFGKLRARLGFASGVYGLCKRK